jgi:hypothetical protein
VLVLVGPVGFADCAFAVMVKAAAVRARTAVALRRKVCLDMVCLRLMSLKYPVPPNAKVSIPLVARQKGIWLTGHVGMG